MWPLAAPITSHFSLKSMSPQKSAVPLEPIERASQDELRALQLTRLKWSLQHAYDRVRHYRERFNALGLHPSNLRTLEDLGKYPFTVKDDLRRNYPFGMLATAREDLIRIHASSGTTGKPTIVGYTRNDIDNWSILMARSIRAAGGEPGQIVLVSYGYGLFTGGLGAHYGAERLGCAVIPMSGGQTEKQVQMITDLQPSIVMMTPSYMLTLCSRVCPARPRRKENFGPSRDLRRRTMVRIAQGRDREPVSHRCRRYLRIV